MGKWRLCLLPEFAMDTPVPAAVVNVIERMSEADRSAFLQLLQKLRALGNDPEKLDPADRALMRELGQRNRALLTLLDAPPAVRANEPANYSASEVSPAVLKTEFYLYLREQLQQEWCTHGGSLEDAVLHAFEQQWLPDELRDEARCRQLYAQYQRELEPLALLRKAAETDAALTSDRRVALGLAWFATLYKVRALVRQGVDLMDS
jgi:hypothetical protein